MPEESFVCGTYFNPERFKVIIPPFELLGGVPNNLRWASSVEGCNNIFTKAVSFNLEGGGRPGARGRPWPKGVQKESPVSAAKPPDRVGGHPRGQIAL